MRKSDLAAGENRESPAQVLHKISESDTPLAEGKRRMRQADLSARENSLSSDKAPLRESPAQVLHRISESDTPLAEGKRRMRQADLSARENSLSSDKAPLRESPAQVLHRISESDTPLAEGKRRMRQADLSARENSLSSDKAPPRESPAQVLRAEDHLGLVHMCAGRFRNRGIPYEDLYSAGCEGLVKAANAFDTSRGVQFSTYAVPVILGEIKRMFRDGGTVHVSRSLRELSMRVQKIREKIIKETGDDPPISVLAEKAGASAEDVSLALCACSPVVSLTAPDDGEGQIDIAVEAPDEGISDRLALRQMMATLAPADRMLLEYRYYHSLTQVQTAAKLGMTQVQVSRREKKLLLYLRQELLK